MSLELANRLFPQQTALAVAAGLERAGHAFDRRAFLAMTAGLERLPLLGRGARVAAALRNVLPQEVPAALAVLERSLEPPLAHEHTEDFGAGVWRYLPHSCFVKAFALEHPREALATVHALTQRFTGEFALRPFLLLHPGETFDALGRWVRDESPHVRRLVSEGTRPRLPWAERLPVYAWENPGTAPLLDALAEDPSEYVRRSVANHWNDLTREDAPRVLAHFEAWEPAARARRERLLRHALRTLVKAGEPRALALLGHAPSEALEVRGTIGPKRAVVGATVTATLTVRNAGAAKASAVVDVAVRFARPSGRPYEKVFKGAVLALAPGASGEVTVRVSLAPKSTRAVYPGAHAFEARVNGRATALGVVHLR